jgi:hypothetical protein
MANHVGPKVSRLIKERAYTAGHCALLRSRRVRLQEELSRLDQELLQVETRIVELDGKITAASAIDTSHIKPIRSTPRRQEARHGAFRRELVRILKEAGGPVSSGALLQHMVAVFNLPMSTTKERNRSRELVRRPLNVFKAKGAVVRLPSTPDTLEGIWCWTDNYVADDSGA